MVVVQAMANGQAPPGLSPGDFVNTNGGMYVVAEPGAYGATYNPASGYWSIKTDSDAYRMSSLLNSASTQAMQAQEQAQEQAHQNSLLSQQFAREQMAFQNSSAQKAMNFSAQQAQIQRDWQEGLSNTAHQREVRDLIAAGLNPILSAHTSGATTPSGASAAGVASSGASGSVDTGATNIAAQILTTMLNNTAAVDIAKLNTAATMYSAEMNANASRYGSVLSSSASRYASDQSLLGTKYTQYAQHLLQEDKQKHDIYMAQNYPSGSQLLGAAMGDLAYTITKLFDSDSRNNGKEFAQSVEDWRKVANEVDPGSWDASLGYKGNLLAMAMDLDQPDKLKSQLRHIKAMHEGNYLK